MGKLRWSIELFILFLDSLLIKFLGLGKSVYHTTKKTFFYNDYEGTNDFAGAGVGVAGAGLAGGLGAGTNDFDVVLMLY